MAHTLRRKAPLENHSSRKARVYTALATRPSTPPRLSRKDLEHPENFHRRLAAWLMKQR